MAPRIRNISPDEFRRLFAAPEIQNPGITSADAVSLINAFETRRSNELKERERFAKIERSIAEAEAKAQDVQTLATERGTAAEREAREVQREGINPLQAGVEEGPFDQEMQTAIDQARGQAEAKVRLDPQGTIEAQRTTERDNAEFAKKVSFQGIKQRDALALLNARDKLKVGKSKTTISALQQREVIKSKGFEGLVNIIEGFEKKIPDSIFKRLGIKANAFLSGNLSAISKKAFGTADQAMLDQVRESVAVAVYKFISGDVGNIAATESKRALRLVPGVLDSKELRAEKVKLLRAAIANAQAAVKAIANDPASQNLTEQQLEDRIRDAANTAFDQAAAELGSADQLDETTFDTVEQAESADLPPGTRVLIGGREAVVE